MARKVDIDEVLELSHDLKEYAETTEASLNDIKQAIYKILSMDSFSGKTANNAKKYFSEIHLTLLDSFSKLFMKMNTDLEKHLTEFQSNVDSSPATRINSDYLLDTKEDVETTYEKLEKEYQSINDTINSVLDISSVTKPDFSPITTDKGEVTKSLSNLNKKLETYTITNEVDSDIKELLHHIKITIDRAGTTKGEQRFTNYVNTLDIYGLPVLKEHVDSYRAEQLLAGRNLPYLEYKPSIKVTDEGSNGSGIVKWQKNNMEVSQGKSVDYEALGIQPSSIELNGHQINYTIEDGDFIIFKDNPDLHYYTQDAVQGKINYRIAEGAQVAANVVGTYSLARVGLFAGEKIKYVKKAFDKLDDTAKFSKEFAAGYTSYQIQSNIPIWREIVGTPIPKVGTKEVILYISDDDGENWDGRVRFVVKSDGEVSYKVFREED
ncbi:MULTISPECIES: T7SS effector LXG polymorphic toxin [Oceanobacillus]|uniref:LXG domain-containing protein n=1 Tax=Oceanobacillus kimchii TaxID=746691 RepID=A0ABQ5TRD4_9BACI|nr:T7SS effector LXG polymorphic toxin [Oceanobacillus kimchii]GLO68314.1 hypothetical protein MACH08_40980 [Oceanobacillus kimchii]